MADFGANYIKFSPIKAQPEGKLPIYRDEGPVELGLLVGADMTPHMAEGSLFAGNVLAENLNMFAYADLDLETDDMLDEVASTVYGCSVEGKLVHYKSGDVPPEGGLAYYKKNSGGACRIFKGYSIREPRQRWAVTLPRPARTPLHSAPRKRSLSSSPAIPRTGGLLRHSTPKQRPRRGWMRNWPEPNRTAARYQTAMPMLRRLADMKAVKLDLAGRTQHLAFTVEAMFQLEEQFGGIQQMVEAVQDSGREGIAAACRVAAILAEQGELGRRSLGYDPEPIVSADEILASMMPSDMIALKLAIPAAISQGYGREVVLDDDEIDVGLAKLRAQKKTR